MDLQLMQGDGDDVRWLQRFANYQRALEQLKQAVDLRAHRYWPLFLDFACHMERLRHENGH